VLCDYAGLRSEIITGYARTNMQQMGSQFKPNHRWNAVLIDSTWNLLDVTWGSGFISYSDQFVKAYDDYYFLTPPEDFIRDHYPEDYRWTLLSDPPTLREFYRTPFKHSAFSKYTISSFAPAKGVIEVSVGDTINIELTMVDIENKRKIAPDTLRDAVNWLPDINVADLSEFRVSNDKKKII
jgi:transglutaminase/protease-like cytokinesis protein 3